jgi:hypothetical protein
MKTSEYLLHDTTQVAQNTGKNTCKISFSLFQKLIVDNSEMRKQVKDIVDLALYDYAIKQNMAAIESFCLKAETETVKLLMKFVGGVSNYQLYSKTIHRNRVIKTLGNLDRKDQHELVQRITVPHIL